MAKWSRSDIPDQTGMVHVVTGANSGIGFWATHALAGRGARVVMACRSLDKAHAAQQRILADHPGAALEVRQLDLADQDSVAAFADGWEGPLHRLINNAGVMALPYRKTPQGFEMQFGTNHLGHFALTGRLWPALAATPGARVVNVSSMAHRVGKIRFDDLQWEKGYQKWPAYGQSKLANLLFTYELARRTPAEGPLAVACHPGYSATHLQLQGAEMEAAGWKLPFMKLANTLFAQDAAAGALPTLRAAVDPDVTNGDYYGPDGFMEVAGSPVPVESNAASHDEEVARRLWEVSMELTGVRWLEA
jgi:NAD(P)-dependent dehydrogenase (short-subunit alcohol dehydrogenase family)